MTLLFSASYPQRTTAAVLYGTGPSFVKADDYPWAPATEERLAWMRADAPRVGSDEWCDETLRPSRPPRPRTRGRSDGGVGGSEPAPAQG